MIKLIVKFLLCFHFILKEEPIINNGIYNFVLNDGKYLACKKNKLIIKKQNKLIYKNAFRIIKEPNSNYYYIENVNSYSKFSISEKYIKFMTNGNSNEIGWIFEKIKSDNKYMIKNINHQCYIIKIFTEFICDNKIEKGVIFNLKLIYEEINHSNKDLELIENTHVDVLIKYIDLTDPTLRRQNIRQIKKDKDNEELRYNIRGILKNISWVRKIFILMPNKKLVFLKNMN